MMGRRSGEGKPNGDGVVREMNDFWVVSGTGRCEELGVAPGTTAATSPPIWEEAEDESKWTTWLSGGGGYGEAIRAPSTVGNGTRLSGVGAATATTGTFGSALSLAARSSSVIVYGTKTGISPVALSCDRRCRWGVKLSKSILGGFSSKKNASPPALAFSSPAFRSSFLFGKKVRKTSWHQMRTRSSSSRASISNARWRKSWGWSEAYSSMPV